MLNRIMRNTIVFQWSAIIFDKKLWCKSNKVINYNQLSPSISFKLCKALNHPYHCQPHHPAWYLGSSAKSLVLFETKVQKIPIIYHKIQFNTSILRHFHSHSYKNTELFGETYFSENDKCISYPPKLARWFVWIKLVCYWMRYTYIVSCSYNLISNFLLSDWWKRVKYY